MKQLFTKIAVIFTILVSSIPPLNAQMRLNPSDHALEFDFGSQLISPDSKYVVYLAQEGGNTSYSLFSIPIGGGIPVKLSESLNVVSGERPVFQLSPDGSLVFFRANDPARGQSSNLYIVPITGGAVNRVNNDDAVNLGVAARFAVTSDENNVVYYSQDAEDQRRELYSAPVSGSTTPVRLTNFSASGTAIPGTRSEFLLNFQLTPDDSKVVFIADEEADNSYGLYSVPVGGGPTTTIESGGLITMKGFTISSITYLIKNQTPWRNIFMW